MNWEMKISHAHYGRTKVFKTNEYLYGKGAKLMPLNIDAVQERIDKLIERRTELYKPHYSEREDMLLNKIVEAISFWENMKRTNC